MMSLNLDHEILKILEENSPFQSDSELIGGTVVSFRDSKIFIGTKPSEYLIENIYDCEQYLSILPADWLFEKNLKVEIDYPKPVYIRYDEQALKRDGFITLSKV